MAIPRKTMRDIHTFSGRVDRIANPYMAYMQITCLEMEKARKGRERASARQRIDIIEARLRDIETEKATLVRALAEREGAPVTMPPSSGRRSPTARDAGGLRLRY